LVEAAYHLLGDHNHRLNGEASVAVVEEILQTRAEQIDDEDVVEAFLAEVVDIGNTS